jgi:hypothetical protein
VSRDQWLQEEPAAFTSWLARASIATPDEVIAFYDRELKARGWTPGNPIGGADLADASWRRPGCSLSLTIWAADLPGPSDLQQAYSGYNLSVSVTVFEDWPPESSSPTTS